MGGTRSCNATGSLLKASNVDAGDGFGFWVSVSGETLAVAARDERSASPSVNGNETDNSMEAAGAAYVFVREASGFRQQAYIKATDPQAHAHFGTGITIDGDTLAVGATDVGTGAVYVFARTETTWSPQARLTPAGGQEGDDFGARLDLSGDTLVATAYFEDSAATGVDGDRSDDSAGNSGAAYVFSYDGTRWAEQAYLKASNTDAGDGFGYAAALSGSRIAIGARYEDGGIDGVGANGDDDSVSDAGAVYTFVKVDERWQPEAYIKPSNPGVGDHFGSAVDLDGDTLVVGARFEDSAARGSNGEQQDESSTDSGAVYVFTREESGWRQQAYLKAANADAHDQFGTSVAIRGNTLLVGARGEAGQRDLPEVNTMAGAGAAYVFERVGETWIQRHYLKASNAKSGHHFGYSVALGESLVVIGAPQEDGDGAGVDPPTNRDVLPGAGAAYAFCLPWPGLEQ